MFTSSCMTMSLEQFQRVALVADCDLITNMSECSPFPAYQIAFYRYIADHNGVRWP